MSPKRWSSKWAALRKHVLARDDYRCGLRIAGICTETATQVDHVIPFSLWPEGEFVEANCVAACRSCNRRKSNRLTGWRETSRPPDEIDPYSL